MCVLSSRGGLRGAPWSAGYTQGEHFRDQAESRATRAASDTRRLEAGDLGPRRKDPAVDPAALRPRGRVGSGPGGKAGRGGGAGAGQARSA